MDFNERIQNAIQRGKDRADSKLRDERAKQLSEEDYRNLHSKHRLELSDHIERCIESLPAHFPGFQLETIYGERGWGAACFRDDLTIANGRRQNNYSRLEMTIRPFSSYHVLDLSGKATVSNKEVFNRNHFQKLTEADPQMFIELIDVWVLEFAEIYASRL